MKRADRVTLRPLNREEQRFAEENHDTIYRFLKWNHYSVEEYYTVVIEAYLRACQTYLNRKDLQQYKFSTIAWKHMQTAIYNDYAAQNRPKRKPERGTISLYAIVLEEYGDNSRCYEDILQDYKGDIVYNLIREEEDKILMEKLWFFLSERQMEIVLFKVDGFSDREIYRQYGLKRKEYLEEMENIKEILASILHNN